MRERDLKTGQFKRSESIPLPPPNRELYATIRFAMKEILIEQERMKRPTPEPADSSLKEIDYTMSIIMKACAALMLFFAALFLAVNL